jgi:hypothetical protein
MKVFLGGTCNGSVWRDELIPQLDCEYYNPVVKDWTPECQAEEIRQRDECDYLLYVITSGMTGVYSIAEAVDDSNKRPGRVIFCVLDAGFNEDQLKSLRAVQGMVFRNGGYICSSLKEVARLLNTLAIGEHSSAPKVTA